MATNTGNGSRHGAVKGRTQFEGPNGNYIKRNSGNGQFMDQKTSDGSKFKGVPKEK